MKIDTKVFEEKMSKSIASLEYEFGSINAGRASASALDKVNVEYFGSSMPVNQIAGISVPDPRTLLITPWDASALKGIEIIVLDVLDSLSIVRIGHKFFVHDKML